MSYILYCSDGAVLDRALLDVMLFGVGVERSSKGDAVFVLVMVRMKKSERCEDSR